MSWTLLAVSLLGALCTWNAHHPRAAGSKLGLPSFLFGWLTGELAVHHIAWQALATALFIGGGALDGWPGWLGLLVTLGSWWGLLRLLPVARQSQVAIERALCEGLGDRYAAGLTRWPLTPEPPRGRLALPFWLTDPAVQITRDLRYADGAERRHLLDVYAPRAGTEHAPVLLQIHGGAWIMGEKREQARPLMNHMAARGWVCVAINYRLSPKHRFPAHLLDIKLAIRWIREHIHAYGGNPDFLVATGGSAGGHLSALTALSANDPEYQPGFEQVDTSVRACVPFYGIYDFANRYGQPGWEGMSKFLGERVFERPFAEDPQAFRKASPVERVHPDAPPFLVIHGDADSLAPVRESRVFVQALRERSKSPVAYAEIPGAQHAFEVFHSPRTQRVVQGVERFLSHVYARYRDGSGSPGAASKPRLEP
ncbi:MAG: alpha/beta hydrolase [Myxococcota bacterium]|nr:alpha/beta hydrolase [Myxococcota bacterium]